MVIENPVPLFKDWIGIASLNWLLAILGIFVLFLIIGFIFLLVNVGPRYATPRLFHNVTGGIGDLFGISLRRVFAIAGLIIKESVRKKVIVVCVVFLILLLFAGWFIDPQGKDPGRLYTSFVFSSTTYLVLLLSIFLSSISLADDFKNKTVFTVVTKPVRPSEVVLGRIVGLGTVGTVILLLMTVLSYLFVAQSLNHHHIIIDGDDVTTVVSEVANAAPTTVIARGTTRIQNGHKHEIEVYANGEIHVSQANGHTHKVTRKEVEQSDSGAQRFRYSVEEQSGTLQAKVPIYGKMKFRNAEDFEKAKGINVGEEWEYRSYVAGASAEAIVWSFDNIDEKRFGDKLPIEMTISVFRTHKGNIEQTIMGTLLVRNPKTGLTATTNVFNSAKYTANALSIPRVIDPSKVEETPRLLKVEGQKESFELPALERKESYDLYKDFVADGKLEIWLQCIEDGQYFGAAEPDLYIRALDANVFMNFFKGYFGLWQQMLMIVCFGVLFSTFLSAPVAMVSTFGVMIAAFCKQLFMQVASRQVLGGGPVEAFSRLIGHDNLMTEMPKNLSTSIIKFIDFIDSFLLSIIGQAIPSFSPYNIYMNSVASGYDIPGNTILVHLLTTFAYIVPLFIVGYVILRNREVAR